MFLTTYCVPVEKGHGPGWQEKRHPEIENMEFDDVGKGEDVVQD